MIRLSISYDLETTRQLIHLYNPKTGREVWFQAPPDDMWINLIIEKYHELLTETR
jgi:hypothetical protein